MTLSKKHFTLAIASVIVSVLVLGFGFQDSTAEIVTIDPGEDSINDIEIETEFQFENIGSVTFTTFAVYEQTGGFKPGETVSFRLFGLADIDKLPMYELADRSFEHRFGSVTSPTNEFNVNVRLTQNELVLHEFLYRDCRMIDYSVNTLFDSEETFSGKTKFAIVDGFEFECKGYTPNTPLFEKLVAKLEKADTPSTKDILPGVTWESYEQFQSKGFEP